MIEFFLNGQRETLLGNEPNQSILDWLRTKMRLLGTKEGCASGDCGACTVVIGSLRGNTMTYESVNSCIALTGSLHGKHLITIDALQNNSAHPVQQAMVECHAAQCGFCTPGIVMSLFALHVQTFGNPEMDVEPALMESLAGNLCRCTGYRSIIDAGRKAMVETWKPDDRGMLAGALSRAEQLQDPNMLDVLKKMRQQLGGLKSKYSRFDIPQSIEELKALKAEFPQARLIAGGTDLALEMTQNLQPLNHLIALDAIAELAEISSYVGGIKIGAAATMTGLEGELVGLWPQFLPLLKRLGSQQIRNRATLGGNIANASPVGDMPPALIALGATLRLNGIDGFRELPLEDFFVGYKKTVLQPTEFIEQICIPKPRQGERLFIYKVSKRFDDDISAVLGAFWLKFAGEEIADCRLAFGGMAATPARARQAEAALKGRLWGEQSVNGAISALTNDFSPLSDARASSSYRAQLAGNLLRRALLHTSTAPDHAPLMVNNYA